MVARTSTPTSKAQAEVYAESFIQACTATALDEATLVVNCRYSPLFIAIDTVAKSLLLNYVEADAAYLGIKGDKHEFQYAANTKKMYYPPDSMNDDEHVFIFDSQSAMDHVLTLLNLKFRGSGWLVEAYSNCINTGELEVVE